MVETRLNIPKIISKISLSCIKRTICNWQKTSRTYVDLTFTSIYGGLGVHCHKQSRSRSFISRQGRENCHNRGNSIMPYEIEIKFYVCIVQDGLLTNFRVKLLAPTLFLYRFPPIFFFPPTII